MNIFKVEYGWYEGEHGETLLCKDIEQKEFEKDLIEAKKFAEKLIGKKIEDSDYLGKGYKVECLPEYYEQIIWFLIQKKDYFESYFDENLIYSIDDLPDKKIGITRCKEKTVRDELR